MRINPDLKDMAIALRREGHSYGEILKKLELKSKGTLSLWFKDLVLSEGTQKLLEKNNRLASERNLFEANRKRSERIKKENLASYYAGLEYVDSLSRRELALIGAALYWGEGAKSEKTPGGSVLAFSNSDPLMVIVYMKFLREVLCVNEERLSVGIHLYPTTDIDEAKSFWAQTTGLQKERFFIVNQISRASQGKRPFNTLPHGTLAIIASNRLHFFRVKGMIEGIGKLSK
ncbi:MAG: hypothetical protein Q8Q03_02480 [bacterium]|nr:hypothetical protein [bacterium]